MTDRMDDLLDDYLDCGEIAAGVTIAERIELERMATAAGLFRATRSTVEAEARASQPKAKARFERFMAANQAAAAAAPLRIRSEPLPRSWLGRVLQMNRGLGAIGVAAAIGVLALVAVFTSQNAFNGTATAAAQVLTPGDYAQVYGTVSSISGEGEETSLMVDSEFGQLRVSVSDVTSVVEANALREIASIRPGESILIAGLVGKNRIIAATTLALAGANATPIVSGLAVAKDLKRTPPSEFDGRVTLITLAKDGIGARLVVAIADGTRYTVHIDRRSAGVLLGSERVIGELVHLVHLQGEPKNLYVVQIGTIPPVGSPAAGSPSPATNPTRAAQSAAPSPLPTTPVRPGTGFVRASGTITGRSANVLSIQTDAGLLNVVIRPNTQVLLGESGLTRGDVLRGEIVIGHSVNLQGGIERATGRVIADVIIVGPKP